MFQEFRDNIIWLSLQINDFFIYIDNQKKLLKTLVFLKTKVLNYLER